MKDFTTLLAPEARQTIQLNRQLRAALTKCVPPAAISAVSLCRLENDQLHITLTSASWLSRLRFTERTILSEVRALNLTATKLKWHVLPGRVEPQRRESIRQEALVIPDKAPQRVLAAAKNFEDDALREALIRVADTMQQRLNEKPR